MPPRFGARRIRRLSRDIVGDWEPPVALADLTTGRIRSIVNATQRLRSPTRPDLLGTWLAHASGGANCETDWALGAWPVFCWARSWQGKGRVPVVSHLADGQERRVLSHRPRRAGGTAMADLVSVFDPEEEASAATGLPGTEVGDPLQDAWWEDPDG